MGSEMTAAAEGKVGSLRHDPMAMLPFCGYNVGDYFRHWLKMGRSFEELPMIFHVNWFRKDRNGDFLWPGYGENMRVLMWIVERTKGKVHAHESALGWLPRYEDIDWRGLQYTGEKWDELMGFNPDAIRSLADQHETLFGKLSDRLPEELTLERDLMASRL